MQRMCIDVDVKFLTSRVSRSIAFCACWSSQAGYFLKNCKGSIVARALFGFSDFRDECRRQRGSESGNGKFSRADFRYMFFLLWCEKCGVECIGE